MADGRRYLICNNSAAIQPIVAKFCMNMQIVAENHVES